MRILITNDDGINARGIQDLAKELIKKHEITIVAPREQKSASSHSISIHTPIKVKEEKIEGLNCKAYSVLGTPADCTQMGLNLLKGEVDLVVSGINRGLNCGMDVLYSGTVSAAIEGAIYSVPALAVSMEVDWNREDEDYTKAARWADKIIDYTYEKYLLKGRVLNLNIPNIRENDIKGLKVCKLGKSTYQTDFTMTEEGEEKIYVLNATRNSIEKDNSDLYYLSQGYITLTPLQFDFTHFGDIEEVETFF